MFKFLFVIAAALMFFGNAATSVAAPPQTSNVYAPFECDVSVDCNDVGNSKLVRNKNGVTMNIQTTGLDSGAVYTVWWVVFNNPEFCEDGCGMDDFDIEAVHAVVIWATGNIVGGNGMSSFAAHLREGDTSNVLQNGLPGVDDGLIDASAAEIHLVIRTHGVPIPGRVREQRTVVSGGCNVNFCDDQQFAVHNP